MKHEKRWEHMKHEKHWKHMKHDKRFKSSSTWHSRRGPRFLKMQRYFKGLKTR